MSSQFKVEDVETALIAKLTDALDGVNVDKIASTDVDADGNIVIHVFPAVRLVYEGTDDQATRDNRRNLYLTTHVFWALCGARNLRSAADQDSDVKKLVSQVRKAIAGVELDLADGTSTEPVGLAGASRFQFDANGSWYQVNLAVTAIAQFS